MILLDGDGMAEEVSVLAPKVGRQFTAITLDVTDFNKLSNLTPATLHGWLVEWRLGFRPPRVQQEPR